MALSIVHRPVRCVSWDNDSVESQSYVPLWATNPLASRIAKPRIRLANCAASAQAMIC